MGGRSDRWQAKVDGLVELAQNNGATQGERDTARRKLAQILRKHPQRAQIRQYGPVRQLFTVGDFNRMHHMGISTEGRWTGTGLEDAFEKMVVDYAERLASYSRRRRLPNAIDDFAAAASASHRPRPEKSTASDLDRILAYLDAQMVETEELIGESERATT